MKPHSRKVLLATSVILGFIAICVGAAVVQIAKCAPVRPKSIPAPATPVDPLLGTWLEGLEYPCDGGMFEERRIERLKFNPDGAFSVEFGSSSTCKRASGTYTHDLATGRITLELLHADCDQLPNEFDGDGFARISPGFQIPDGRWGSDSLYLEGIRIGTGEHGTACTMMFGRR